MNTQTYCETHGVNLVQNDVCELCERGIVLVKSGELDGGEDKGLRGQVYLDVSINGSYISGWVSPQVAALIKGLDSQCLPFSATVSQELAQLGKSMEIAGKAMREATIEVNRQRLVIDQYRDKNADHERLIGKLLELLDEDDMDGARDLVKREYDGIHGPND